MLIQNLATFVNFNTKFESVIEILKTENISSIKIFALGPDGTNIGAAAKQWVKEFGIWQKTEFIYCDTPEEELRKAEEVKDNKIFPIFSLCAVYFKLYEMYFNNFDSFFFMHHYYMQLDDMQLASRHRVEEYLPDNWIIASHPSPSPLIANLKAKKIIANSNSDAAKMCANGLVDACITTETARNLYSLNKLHSFGSPMMLFTFGTTKHGINIIEKYIAI